MLSMKALAFFVFCFFSWKIASSKHEKILKSCQKYTQCRKQRPLALIVGGEDVNNIGDYPHMVLIGFGKHPSVNYECGGSLISVNYVLSAAHCENDANLRKASHALLGLANRNYRGPHLQQRNIIKTIVYPKYKRPNKYHDIALFRLDEKVIVNDAVRPACLYPDFKMEGTLTAIGFGKTSFMSSGGSKQLKKVDVGILSNKICQPFYKKLMLSTMKEGIIDGQMCAGVLEGGRDTCQGDSGGPLQIPYSPSDCAHYIVGVTSFGNFCGYPKSPSIYTRVANYLNWIESVVWP